MTRLASGSSGGRTGRQLLLILILNLFLLDQLLLGYLRRGGNLRDLAVEGDFGLFEITAGI